jgi:hypothetical protein
MRQVILAISLLASTLASNAVQAALCRTGGPYEK